MKSLPLPIRLAAGLAVTAVEQARELPGRIAGLPVTVVSQALQASMRLQQHVTELAVKGDEALALLRPAEESPEWATFDEDLDDGPDRSRPAFDRVDDPEDADGGFADFDDDYDRTPPAAGGPSALDDVADAEVEPALEYDLDKVVDPDDLADLAELDGATPEQVAAESARPVGPPASVPNYGELSLPQLRARLRSFSVPDLEELLDYERATENRPSFVGMLTRRVATVRDQAAPGQGSPDATAPDEG